MSDQYPAPRPSGEAVPAPTGIAPVGQEWTADAVRERASEVADQAGVMFDKAHDAVEDVVDQAVEATKEAAATVVSRIRNNATIPAERGQTTIRNEVVEKIAGIAARDVPGVYDLGGDTVRIFSAVRERIGLGENEADQGVRVKLNGKQAELKVTIVIEFGYLVTSVTDKVREKVISSVENMLALEVTEVDVIVDDVHIPNEGPVGDDAVRATGYDASTPAIVVG